MLLARAIVSMLAGLFLLISIATMSMATSAPVQDTIGMSVREWETLWTRILADHVDGQGHIDFGALKRAHADLDRVVAFIATVDPASRPQLFPSLETRLAYYINAYNALAMYGVVDAGVPNSLGGLTKFKFFYLRRFTIGGKSVSLYSFENDVIRPLGEERVHFALNCMVVSCPRLPRTAFTADQVDHQLRTAAQEFVNETRNVRVDAAARTVWLSAIFNFYTKDFLAHVPSLIDYVNRYRTGPIPQDFGVRYLDYDWTVNQVPALPPDINRRRRYSGSASESDRQA